LFAIIKHVTVHTKKLTLGKMLCTCGLGKKNKNNLQFHNRLIKFNSLGLYSPLWGSHQLLFLFYKVPYFLNQLVPWLLFVLSRHCNDYSRAVSIKLLYITQEAKIMYFTTSLHIAPSGLEKSLTNLLIFLGLPVSIYKHVTSKLSSFHLFLVIQLISSYTSHQIYSSGTWVARMEVDVDTKAAAI